MTNKTKLNRRELFQYSAMSLSGLGFNPSLFAETQEEPHFLLILFVSGGLDSTYLFDARSLNQYKAKLQTNYLNTPQEPTIWNGTNGGMTKVTSLVKPLEKWRKHFSILNGVLMADNFDGHEQNINLALTGNAFGGDWFAPFLNFKNQYSLDGVNFLGNIFADFPTNGSGTLSLTPSALGSLSATSSKESKSQKQDPLIAFAASRAAFNAKSTGAQPLGRFAQGAEKMHRGLLESVSLKGKITKFNASIKPGIIGLVESSMQVFKAGISKTVALSLDDLEEFQGFNFDVHGFEDAKKSPDQYNKLIVAVEKVFDLLQKTQFPGTQKSFLDVTTVLMTSEFNRTTRQMNMAIDKSGTDHNPLSNTVLIGGKGIKGDLIVGATDLDALNGQTYAKISGAHKSLDPQMIKTMGKPFDIKELKVLNTDPQTYQRTQYLTIENVVNTLLKAFGVTKKEHYRSYAGDRSGTPAPSLDKLLS